MDTSEDRRRERAELRAKYGHFYDELVALFFRHDPIGLDYETNTDEYDQEVRAIIPRLASCASVADVARVTHEVFVQKFDETMAGQWWQYEQLAIDVWSRWCAVTSS